MLVVVGGRAGVGKTTCAAEVARRMPANFVRLDAIETASTGPASCPEAASVSADT
ncbi:MAG: AAA family ATPase [Ilumatobacter sp.]